MTAVLISAHPVRQELLQDVKQEHSVLSRMAQAAWKTVAEVIKIFAATLFLSIAWACAYVNQPAAIKERALLAIVAAPLIEEILFRGILQKTIHLIQHLTLKKNPTEMEKIHQKTFRVQLSSLLFGAAHLTNEGNSPLGRGIQCTWSYFGGVSYGYLSEKYQTLSMSILAHGLNNMIATAGSHFFPKHPLPILSLVLVNRIFWHVLAESGFGNFLKGGANHIYLFAESLSHPATKALV